VSPFLRPARVYRADHLVARSVFFVLLALFTATMVTQPDTYDGEVEFQTTSALAREQTLALGGTPEADAIVEASFNGRRGGPGREDEFFSWFGVGQAFVGFPFYCVGAVLGHLMPEYETLNRSSTHAGIARSEYFEHLFVLWRNPVLAALTAALLMLSSRRLGASRRNAWIAALAYGLCTFVWPQARSTSNSVQTTFFLFLAFHQILVFEEAFTQYRRPTRLSLVVCGLALGAAFLTRSLSAPVIVVLGLGACFVLWRGAKRPGGGSWFTDVLSIAVPALACFGVFLWTNATRFGDPLEQGYGDVVTWESYFNYPLHLGLVGILGAPGQGLLWMAPACLLALPWAWQLWRRRELRMLVLLLGVAAGVLVPVCLTVGWHGAWGYGPRYALPLLPFLWLGVGMLLDQKDELPWLHPIAWGLLLSGLTVSVPGVLVDTTTHTDLATKAARLEWPELPGNPETQEEERFHRIRWDLRFAAPWAHWRILRHRVAGLGEEFPLDEIFFSADLRPAVVDGEMEPIRALVPTNERERGFSHLAWVDFSTRLGGPVWPVSLLCFLFLFAGALTAAQGLDPDRP